MEFLGKKIFFTVFLAILVLVAAFSLMAFITYHKSYSKYFINTSPTKVNAAKPSSSEQLPQKLANPPAVLKIAYMTGWSAGSKNYINYLQSLFKTAQINAVVIDVKDYSGVVSYKTGAAKAKEYKAYWPEISDIDALVNKLHNQGVYVIGRVVVFEDPVLAKNRPDLAIYDTSKTQEATKPVVWKNNDGLSWVDPASKEVWDYNIAIAKDAAEHGFDEINFDYVRFPTDGNAGSMGFPVWDNKTQKSTIIKNFFQKLRESLPNIKISADIFGQTTTNTDDMGIGQIFENTLSYFDYVCPMVYPSHYADGFDGFLNPADHPYQIISCALGSAVTRRQSYASAHNLDQRTLAKIRPWLQDFNLGAVYDAPMVTAEIKAVTDTTGNDFSGFMLWSPSNIYTAGAIAK